MARLQSGQQYKLHAFPVMHHISVGEPDRPEAGPAFKVRVPTQIALVVMGMPVDLDDKAFIGTEEIDNPVVDGGLPAKLEPAEAAIPEFEPEETFGFGGFAAHSCGACQQCSALSATTPNPLL